MCAFVCIHLCLEHIHILSNRADIVTTNIQWDLTVCLFVCLFRGRCSCDTERMTVWCDTLVCVSSHTLLWWYNSSHWQIWKEQDRVRHTKTSAWHCSCSLIWGKLQRSYSTVQKNQFKIRKQTTGDLLSLKCLYLKVFILKVSGS